MAQHNIFYQEPDRTRTEARIVACRHHELGTALALDPNIVRASGGGEPRDIGHVGGHPIMDVEKRDGLTWLVVASSTDNFADGAEIQVEVDADHRSQRRRLHTGTHLLIRSTLNHLGTFIVEDAQIDDDAQRATVTGITSPTFSIEDATAIDKAMRSHVLSLRSVQAIRAKSVEAAQETCGSLFRFSGRHTLKGKVRVVVIEDIDANPCSGLHHSSSDIGPYELSHTLSEDGSGQVEFVLRLTPTWMYWFGD